MSWFDKLFGEDNDSNDDAFYRKQRRQSNKNIDNENSLLPENNDIYERPKGKFRFPISVTENNENQSNDSSYRDRNGSQTRSSEDWDSSILDSSYQSNSMNQGHRRRNRRNFEQGQDDKNESSFNRNETRQKRNKTRTQQSNDISNKTSDKRSYSTTSRYKLQSAQLKSNSNDKITYRSQSFKATEVPSAIFGTKKRKPIKNGVIPQNEDKDESELNHHSKMSHSKDTHSNSANNNSYSNTDYQNEEHEVNQVDSAQSNSNQKTPNYSSRDNTINIENIYASQIVEEIRKERERKALQKKRFKQALQDKRLQNQKQEDSISKAIDDMYAKQARQYTGESSLDESQTSNELNENNSLNDSKTDIAEEHDGFNYQEVDLNDINEVHEMDENNINVKEVEVSTELIEEDDQESSLDDRMQEISLDDNDNLGNDTRNYNDSHSQDDSSSLDNVSEAEYRELDSEDDKQAEQDDLTTHTNQDNNVSVQSSKPSKHDNNNDLEHHQTSDDSHERVKDSEQINQNFNSETKSNENVKINSSIKPFNVVMTPSDKKRLKTQNNFTQNRTTDVNKYQTGSSENEIDISRQENNETQTSHKSDNELNHVETEAQHDNNETSQVEHSKNISNTKPTFSKSLNENNQETEINKDSKKETHIRKGPNINLPSLELLEEAETHEVDESWIEGKKQELNDAFYYFNVLAEVKHVTEGPSVTRFELAVEKGVKVSRITALQDDIKMALAAKDIRIEAPIPGTSLVGIEVPNLNATKVNLKSILDSSMFKNAESKLTVAMGNRINNEPLLMDIAKTPHALIAGATGSGKSVCINSILMSLLYRNHPEELRLLLIDPKMVELAPYNGLPHLVSPVITDVKAATQSLKWAVDEMERRYKLFAQYHVRNITAYNKKASYDQRLPKIVIVIDELADLMMMAPQEVEQAIARIAQKARACGIHMLVATQRPSVNVITGLIKANIPTRIAFMVSSGVDSRTILDNSGAERLLGYGDMLYLGSGMNKPIRVQGTFVSDEEIDDVVEFIKSQREPDYLFEEKELLKKTNSQPKDDLFDAVCEFMVKEGHISTSLIQRHFQIGYNRAARIVDQLEQLDYISGANGSKPRDVFITEADLKKD